MRRLCSFPQNGQNDRTQHLTSSRCFSSDMSAHISVYIITQSYCESNGFGRSTTPNIATLQPPPRGGAPLCDMLDMQALKARWTRELLAAGLLEPSKSILSVTTPTGSPIISVYGLQTGDVCLAWCFRLPLAM